MPSASTIHVESLDQFADMLSREAERLESISFRDPLTDCTALVLENITDNFVLGQNPDGYAWQPLAPSTLEKPRADARPLIGTFRKRLFRSTNQPGELHIREITDDRLEVGTLVEYAGYQNWGTSRIPQREYMGISETTTGGCAEIIVGWFAEQIGGEL